MDETGSTNADLAEAAAHGAPDRTVLAARHQTAGRGRMDRAWEAPPGANLLVSLLFRPPAGGDVDGFGLIRRVALAIAAAVRTIATSPAAAEWPPQSRVADGGQLVTLKWPNDVLLGEAKLAGILARAGGAGAAAWVVVGAGVNVGWAPPGAARVADIAADVSPEHLLAGVLREFDALRADPGALHELYRAGLATIGRRVRVDMVDGSAIEGQALDVEPDGRLVVLDGCAGTHRVAVGDVVHLRPA